ncbi:MAG: hypothetical protein KQI78_25750 [Deltaproteobacteria bacterium]|nr:hypothetical protein [Deltaproteobacteria bacterium]
MTKPNLWQRIRASITAPPRREKLEVREVDEYLHVGAYARTGRYPYERFPHDRAETLRQVMDAWREDPLARRVVELNSQYVVGGGMAVDSPHPGTHAFIQRWWEHRLNRMPTRIIEWCDELTRTGNLFVLLSTDAAGMSYLRAVPTAEVEEIVTAPNDVDQPVEVLVRSPEVGEPPQRYPVYDPNNDIPSQDGQPSTVALHYAINRPVGARWGESDLAPLLVWLRRYSGWLEHRVRLNYFRQLFLFVVKGDYRSEADRRAREAAINARPPSPGSVLVTTEDEEWSVMAPQLSSFEAAEDGLAVKKMIAAGASLPLHFLAEPEEATRTTAEAAGGPTYRHFEQRQLYFRWMIGDLARAAVMRRAAVDPAVDPEAVIQVRAADLSARDNAALAVATSTMLGAWLDLWERGLIDSTELLRMAYRFAGESDVDIGEILERGGNQPPTSKINANGSGKKRSGRPGGVKIDERGDVQGTAAI